MFVALLIYEHNTYDSSYLLVFSGFILENIKIKHCVVVLSFAVMI